MFYNVGLICDDVFSTIMCYADCRSVHCCMLSYKTTDICKEEINSRISLFEHECLGINDPYLMWLCDVSISDKIQEIAVNGSMNLLLYAFGEYLSMSDTILKKRQCFRECLELSKKHMFFKCVCLTKNPAVFRARVKMLYGYSVIGETTWKIIVYNKNSFNVSSEFLKVSIQSLKHSCYPVILRFLIGVKKYGTHPDELFKSLYENDKAYLHLSERDITKELYWYLDNNVQDQFLFDYVHYYGIPWLVRYKSKNKNYNIGKNARKLIINNHINIVKELYNI
jgi:hypothetical protein